jgi:hypothetical protein
MSEKNAQSLRNKVIWNEMLSNRCSWDKSIDFVCLYIYNFLCYLSISHLLYKLFVCCFHQGACLALNRWFYIVAILAFGRMIYLKVTLASLELSTFTFILKWTYYIITTKSVNNRKTVKTVLHIKLEVFIWRHVVYVPKSSTIFRGILICVISRLRDMFIYWWVLTFPLLDCSEFGNVVVTLM